MMVENPKKIDLCRFQSRYGLLVWRNVDPTHIETMHIKTIYDSMLRYCVFYETKDRIQNVFSGLFRIL